ncbi:carbon-nitrogen hydrolase domain-containing protein [Ditylenchus destructor]|nr:carbon-nitrogen hydrolase domain-containing protein [Ditylenchus destructor]
MSTNAFLTARRNMVAICQLTSQHDLQENLRVCTEMIARAKARNCKMVFFPECFDYIGRTREETISLAMEEDSDYIQNFRKLAQENNLWLSLGGFHHKVPSSGSLPFNTHLIINEKGETAGSYQKLHLFDLDIPNKVRLMESEFSVHGKKLHPPVDTPIGKMGLAICYDVRFPELSLYYRHRGAEILTYPSSFTVNTGLAHWEALLRARAIETQSYVIGAAQTGKHNDKRSSYGHSMVVDPWGAIIGQCSETVDMCFAEINLDYLYEVRKMQPVFTHRRSDLYSVLSPESVPASQDMEFDSHKISKETIFYQTSLSYAFVNLKPIVPGHVLCTSIRKAERLADLTDQETADMFILAKKVQRMLESHFKTVSFNVDVQDGPDSGQTVAHVHIHIVPRHKNDKLNINAELQGHEDRRVARSLDEMAAEAAIYRNLMAQNCDLAKSS